MESFRKNTSQEEQRLAEALAGNSRAAREAAYAESRLAELSPYHAEEARLLIQMERDSVQLEGAKSSSSDSSEIQDLEAQLRELKRRSVESEGRMSTGTAVGSSGRAQELAESEASYAQAKEQLERVRAAMAEKDRELRARYGL